MGSIFEHIKSTSEGMNALFTLVFVFVVSGLMAQKWITPEEYILMYKDIAIKEMKKSGIPASITLAQGIHESGSGNSRLAVQANNHFGIKCHGWKGGTIYADDDAPNECFRKYKTPEESFADHSEFLTIHSRYAFLFELRSTDYKGWARGLKKAGYATSPTYAEDLIKVIEKYQLYKYDKSTMGLVREEAAHTPPVHIEINEDETFTISVHRPVEENNGVEYVVVKPGDTFESLADEFEMFSWELARFNGMPRNANLEEGQKIYIQPKRSRAARGEEIHVAEKDESMWDISQQYAVKLKKLYKRSEIEPGTELEEGDTIYLRNHKKGLFERWFGED